MTRRNIEELTNRTSPPEDPEAIMSPPPPQASPAARSPINGAQDAPSPPTMLATMTPVNVLELKKDANERRHSDDHPVFQVKTEMIYSDKEESDMYHGMSEKHHAPIDLIYEDGNKTVIYTTTPDQKGLEIYSAQNDGEITINNINSHSQLHAQLSDVLMDGESSSMVGGHCEEGQSGNPPGTVSVVLPGGGQGLLQYSQAQVPPTTVLVLSELVEDMSTVPVLGLR